MYAGRGRCRGAGVTQAVAVAVAVVAAVMGGVASGKEPSAGIPPRGSVADRIRATGFGAAVRPPLSDEHLVKRAEAIEAHLAQSVIDTLCTMAAEVEYGILDLSGATRGKGRGVGNILAGEPDKNIYATTLKAAKLSRDLRKEAEERGGSCDAAHSAAGRISLR